MIRKRRRRVIQQGAVPGEVAAPEDALSTRLEHVHYSTTHFESEIVRADEEIQPRAKSVNWVVAEGFQDVELLQQVIASFTIHPLALEDAMQAQRPRFVNFETHFMLTIPVMRVDFEDVEFMSAIVTNHAVITLQRQNYGVKPPIKERLSSGRGRIRRKGTDYLAYAILDSAIDLAFPVVEKLTIELEGIEEQASSDSFPVDRVRDIRKLAQNRRRVMRQTKEAISDLLRHEDFLDEKNRTFFRDCQAHVVDLGTEFELLMELADHQLAAHETFLQQKTALAMQTLTVVSAVFIPLSFLSGLYGMNFDPQASPWNMPELSTRFGYPVLLSVMFLVAITMLRHFKKRGLL